VAELLDGIPRFLTGNPVWFPIGARVSPWGDPAVEAHGDLHEHKGALVLYPLGEAFVQPAGFVLANPSFSLNSCGGKRLYASAGDVGIGVGGGRHDTGNACVNKGLCAGAGAARMVAGFQGDVCGGALQVVFICVLSSSFESGYLSMVEEIVFVPAFADEFTIAVEDDAADGGVGGYEAGAATGEVEGAVHPVGVLVRGGHGMNDRIQCKGTRLDQ